MDALTDESKMPWGQYAGKRMDQIPGHYLMWVHKNMARNQNNKTVHDYIIDNLEIIEKECSQTTKEEF